MPAYLMFRRISSTKLQLEYTKNIAQVLRLLNIEEIFTSKVKHVRSRGKVKVFNLPPSFSLKWTDVLNLTMNNTAF